STANAGVTAGDQCHFSLELVHPLSLSPVRGRHALSRLETSTWISSTVPPMPAFRRKHFCQRSAVNACAALWDIGTCRSAVYGAPRGPSGRGQGGQSGVVANALVMSCIATNHFLNLLTEVNDPLANTLSVTAPRWLERPHLDF